MTLAAEWGKGGAGDLKGRGVATVRVHVGQALILTLIHLLMVRVHIAQALVLTLILTLTLTLSQTGEQQ